MSEAEFTRQVLALAKLLGWRTFHARAARTTKGWRTPVQGDGKGFADIVCVRERVLWIELKTDTGKLTPEQDAWIKSLRGADQEVHVWRPRDWPEIEKVLR